MTFEQMKQQIAAAAATMKEQQQKTQASAPQQASTTEVKFQMHVRKTGQAKDVSGLSTDGDDGRIVRRCLLPPRLFCRLHLQDRRCRALVMWRKSRLRQRSTVS